MFQFWIGRPWQMSLRSCGTKWRRSDNTTPFRTEPVCTGAGRHLERGSDPLELGLFCPAAARLFGGGTMIATSTTGRLIVNSQTLTIVAVVVMALVVVAIAVVYTQCQRRVRLRERFGPEYDRTVTGGGRHSQGGSDPRRTHAARRAFEAPAPFPRPGTCSRVLDDIRIREMNYAAAPFGRRSDSGSSASISSSE